ncbi:hypothetical protein [Enterococcus faecium]|uniref:hypothetical protein n=1 Tax=Enterococcus faecium TaxID=1352 RepID=UPI000C0204AB|nr:hypothetical protein [Enterococcus faecium]PHK57263.1 hypothetical protein CR198_13075 [Enterococcus faecium]
MDISTKNYYLDEILKTKLNENNSIKILKDLGNPNGYSATMEVLSNNDNYVFGKLGKEHDINQFQIRKTDTLKSRDISKAADELFESFSYFLIDKSTFSVSYIKETTAPNISYLSYLITNEFISTDKIRGWIECLVDKDAIEMLSGKDIIGTMEYDITLPPEYTKSLLRLSEKEYDLLQHQKGIRVAVTLQAARRKTSVFEEEKDATNFFTSMMKKGIDLKVKAKDESDEFMQDFKLVENPFTKRVNFNYDNSKISSIHDLQSSIEEQLWLKTQQNKHDILSYIGFDD